MPSHGYDSGGTLQPGATIVHNGTGKPEPVLTQSQWSALYLAQYKKPKKKKD